MFRCPPASVPAYSRQEINSLNCESGRSVAAGRGKSVHAFIATTIARFLILYERKIRVRQVIYPYFKTDRLVTVVKDGDPHNAPILLSHRTQSSRRKPIPLIGSGDNATQGRPERDPKQPKDTRDSVPYLPDWASSPDNPSRNGISSMDFPQTLFGR